MADYTKGDTRLHTAYAFDFLGPWPGVERMADILGKWREGEGDGWPSWAFSNHDVARVATRWGEAINAPIARGAVLFTALLLCLRGTIFLYQGEELGLPEASVPFEALQDPWGIAGWPAMKGRDGCRTPMPWRDAPTAGFTKAKTPWLPVDPRHRPLAADVQDPIKGSTLGVTRTLIATRKASAALTRGSFRVLEAADGQLVFERVEGEERVWCAFNLTDQPRERTAPGDKPTVLWTWDAALAGSKLAMEPFSAAIVRV
jgi:alpha-glucosidase